MACMRTVTVSFTFLNFLLLHVVAGIGNHCADFN